MFAKSLNSFNNPVKVYELQQKNLKNSLILCIIEASIRKLCIYWIISKFLLASMDNSEGVGKILLPWIDKNFGKKFYNSFNF